jgi:REP element-mobilizing transposase RayT
MAKYDPQKHHRRSIRLKGHDYSSPGAYFVTVCTKGRECVLDDPVVTGIIRDVWHALPRWFPTTALDEFVVMPNHVHFIVWIHPPDGGTTVGTTLAVAHDGTGVRASLAPTNVEWVIPKPQKVNPNPSLGDVVGAFKSLVFKVYLDWVQAHDPARRAKFWQRNYYEHIIRSERALRAMRRYIRQNPDNWELDCDNLDNIHHLSPPKTVEEYVQEALTSDEST